MKTFELIIRLIIYIANERNSIISEECIIEESFVMIDCMSTHDIYRGETKKINGKLESKGKNKPELKSKTIRKVTFNTVLRNLSAEEIPTSKPTLDTARMIGII